MPTPERTFTLPRRFVVGDVSKGADFSVDYINSLIYRIALWFQKPECDRTYDDPVESAKAKIRECLLGIKEDGNPWQNCPKEFAARVRAKAAYDIEKDAGIPSRRVKHPAAQAAQAAKQAEQGANKIGNDMADVLDFDAEGFRTKMEADMLANFPELDNPAHLPNLRSLIMYYVEREKIDGQLKLGVSDAKRLTLLDSLKRIEDMADTTMKRLGIHPDQIRKKISDKGASTIADLVNLISNDTDYKKREKTWALQLALQLWWMSQHMNGAGTGPQVHDFEIWHMTRSRPIQFTCEHGTAYTLVEGFEPEELRKYLVQEGVLIEEPVLPQYTDAAALKGLATADLTTLIVPPDEDTQEAHDGDGSGSPDPAGDPDGGEGESRDADGGLHGASPE
jgi:hypothetical protein